MRDGTAAGLSLPAENTAATYQSIQDVLSDTITIKSQVRKNGPILMSAIKDEDGEMVAHEEIKAAVVTARFRNVAERNGKVDIAFDVTIPGELTDTDWLVQFHPLLLINGDTLRMDDLQVTGAKYRKMQLRGYEKYNKFLASIISDSTKMIDRHQLEVFIQRNYKSLFGVTREEAVEHFTRDYIVRRNRRKIAMKDRMRDKYIKMPIVKEGLRLDTIVSEGSSDIVYRYVQTLDVSSNNLTDAGFSDLMAYLPNLTELQFNANRSITRFDAGMNTKLRKLSCYGCALTSLDVRGCTELQELGCDDNQLTFLNLSENTKLRRLQTGGNRLTEIYGLSALTELRNLVCENNQIATLDVSTFPMLAELQCGDNSLTTLDLRQNGNLRYLYVEKNQLSTLLLPESAPLKWLRIFGNQLKNDAMRAIVEKLPTLATTYNVRAYYEGLSTEGNELSAAVVSAMRAKNWNPQYTTTGTSWQDYAGGTVTYALKLCGTSVTSANAANLSAISGVTGTASFDELTNTLTLSGATINHSNSVGLENSIDGLTIVLEGKLCPTRTASTSTPTRSSSRAEPR